MHENFHYNNRMFLTQWNVPGVLAYAYHYDYYGENNTGRVVFADNLYNGASRDATLDRSWYYEDMGRFGVGYTGSEARATIGTDTWGHPDGPYAQGYVYDVWGNRTHEEGWGGIYGSYTNGNPTYTSNRRDGGTYDLAGNYTAGGAATYDATGQQVAYTSASLSHVYDGDRLRGKKVDHGVATYYVRSSVLGGQVVAEINSSGTWMRGYVYLGGQLIALQDSGVWWVHQEPYSKGQRFTNSLGSVAGNIVEVDPWGGNTARSVSSSFQPHLYASYERDSDGGDDAMNRRYSPTWSRFSQPDPYDGSYDSTNPQSFNRYSYVSNDPVNLIDPSGLLPILDCSDDMENGIVRICHWESWPDLPGLFPRGDPNPRGSGGSALPQNPSGSYQACKGLASIPEGPANDILSVSGQQGTDPGLLAVTWGHESGFSYNPPPNPRWNEDRTKDHPPGTTLTTKPVTHTFLLGRNAPSLSGSRISSIVFCGLIAFLLRFLSTFSVWPFALLAVPQALQLRYFVPLEHGVFALRVWPESISTHPMARVRYLFRY